jgi:hypothetical protein
MSDSRIHPRASRPVVVAADVSGRLLSVHFQGAVTAEHTKVHVHEIEAALPQLGFGFTLITDLTGLDSMELECVPHIARAMDLCLAGGVAKVMRIIPDPQKDIGFTLLSLVHYRGKVPIITCQTRTEAERELSRA